jgi:hypothetical protein
VEWTGSTFQVPAGRARRVSVVVVVVVVLMKPPILEDTTKR